MALLAPIETPWAKAPVTAYVKLVPITRGDELQGVRQLIYRDAEARKAGAQPLVMRPLGQEIVREWAQDWAKALSAAGATPCKLAYARAKSLPAFAAAKDC
jgi:hypothetical protein